MGRREASPGTRDDAYRRRGQGRGRAGDEGNPGRGRDAGNAFFAGATVTVTATEGAAIWPWARLLSWKSETPFYEASSNWTCKAKRARG